MVRSINESAMADSDNYLIAQGYSLNQKALVWIDTYGAESFSVRNGGMITLERYTVPPQSALFRFSDARGDIDTITNGAWWLERKEFDQILRFSEVNEISIGRAVRLLCCVPPEWGSKIDYLVRVRTREWLSVYRGLANGASAKDDLTSTHIEARNDIDAWRLHQIFVPGLRDPRTGKPMGDNRRFFMMDGEWIINNRYTWIYE